MEILAFQNAIKSAESVQEFLEGECSLVDTRYLQTARQYSSLSIPSKTSQAAGGITQPAQSTGTLAFSSCSRGKSMPVYDLLTRRSIQATI